MMQPQQQAFDTFSTWILTRLINDLATSHNSTASPLYAFFTCLYEDMLANPGNYAIPVKPFVNFYVRVTFTPEEIAQHEALKAARMHVRKVIYAYLEFLFKIGKTSHLLEDTGDPVIISSGFEKIIAEAMKKSKNRNFLAALERSGLSFTLGDPVIVSNKKFPRMPAELVRFCQACSSVKEFDFYLFRRCDFAVFDGKNEPAFMDALNLVPQPFQQNVAKTDNRLQEMNFKREIFVDGGDMTYRVRYSRKSDQVVYWVRILETFHPDLGHYLRWKLTSDLTRSLFLHLDGIAPGLSDLVYEGLKPCAHCYPGNCMDRVNVAWKGKIKEACKGEGWNKIGFTHADYENLWIVLGALNQLA